MSTTARGATRGVPAAPGIAIGPYVRYERRVASADRRVEDVTAEVKRLEAACEAVARESERVGDELRRSGHASEARIFDAHAEMARDPALLEEAIARIAAARVSAGSAITAAAEATASALRGLDDPLLAARSSDVIDVGDRIARAAAGARDVGLELAAPTIVVADDLPPSVTATLRREHVLAIVLEGSSPTAHAAILARAYGIPAIVGASELRAMLDTESAGTTLAVDGKTGDIIVAPDARAIAEFRTRANAIASERAQASVDAALPALTRDGVRVSLLANIGSPLEAAAARALGASGVGLFRTEFLFLERDRAPSEDEQARAYGEAAAALAPDPVTIRLLDVGGDKPITYLPMPHEDNPFLGVRALRLAPTQRDLFITQLRACYRAALRGRIKVMAPMVADLADVEVFLDLARAARDGLAPSDRGDAELGVMIEIPSAVLAADAYFARVSFASLGTNDLLQYTMAADRGNAALERYRDPLHPAHLALIRLAVEAAGRRGIDLSVCGEMAGDATSALVLVGLGLRSLSMTAASLASVRRAIRRTSVADLERRAQSALRDGSAAHVRDRFRGLAGD